MVHIIIQPHLKRNLEQANDVEMNPGPRKLSRTKSMRNFGDKKIRNDNDNNSPLTEEEKLNRLEEDIAALQLTLAGIDKNVSKLHKNVEQLKPVYNEAKMALGSASSQLQKNNLVFHGIKPDPLEVDMMDEPDFCRDILETRIKSILKEHLKITRDITFFQVMRIHAAPMSKGSKPIVACFTSIKDKENVLRQSKLLQGKGIYITEDISSRKYSNRRISTTKEEYASGEDSEKLQQNKDRPGSTSDYTNSSASGTD